MSFLTTLISSFPLLSYSIHHITLSSYHFHSHLVSSHHSSHHHSHCHISNTIHLFILTTFHAFSHHLICITLITSHIHLSFIPHHSHSYSPSIPSFSHFSLFHSSISPWCSSRFPQNSFSLIFFNHTILFIIPSFFPSYFTSITLITTHLCFSFIFASMFSIHPFPSISISLFLSVTSITLTIFHFHSNTLIPFHFIISIHLHVLI